MVLKTIRKEKLTMYIPTPFSKVMAMAMKIFKFLEIIVGSEKKHSWPDAFLLCAAISMGEKFPENSDAVFFKAFKDYVAYVRAHKKGAANDL